MVSVRSSRGNGCWLGNYTYSNMVLYRCVYTLNISVDRINRVKRADSLVTFVALCLVGLGLGNAKSKPSRKFGAQI